MDIECQNCFMFIGEKTMKGEEEAFTYNPKVIDAISQDIDANTTLLTLRCPQCKCMLQIII